MLVRAGRQEENGNERWLLIKTGEGIPPIGKKKDDQSALTGRSMKEIATDKKSVQWMSSRDRAK